MEDNGDRNPQHNLCVHSKAALEIVSENVLRYAKILRPTTGRYFYWIDDGKPMCHCPKCRGLSDSDQALILENQMLKTLRTADPRASIAHLVYVNTRKPPTQVKPEPGVFVEFAPFRRRYDVSLAQRSVALGARRIRSHGEYLDVLDANLEIFGREGAQALEYWLDAARFAGYKQDQPRKIPWDTRVFLEDLKTYAACGIQHITTFATSIDAEYVRRFGEPPINEYGNGLLQH
jgi:hypothetical protein